MGLYLASDASPLKPVTCREDIAVPVAASACPLRFSLIFMFQIPTRFPLTAYLSFLPAPRTHLSPPHWDNARTLWKCVFLILLVGI